MLRPVISLSEVDGVSLTTIVDNSIDVLMAGTPVAQRLPVQPMLFERPLPTAQHGFAMRIAVRDGERHATLLFDTGVSRQGTLHNLDALQIDLGDIQAIVLSHGHADHALGLTGIVDRLGTRRLPLVLHPDAYLERRLVLPNGDEIRLPPPRRADLARENIELIEEIGPSLVVDGMVLVSGEVARTTDFEKGFAVHQARHGDMWEPDPLIHDDQCAIVNVRGKGLVIVTGCGHAGIINIIRNAQALTGVETIYAVVGGYHLTGALFVPLIPPTVAALRALQPRWLVPCHCTGWVAVHAIAREMPDAFIANSVGTTLVL